LDRRSRKGNFLRHKIFRRWRMLERPRVWFTLFLVIGLLFLVAGLRADDGQLAGSDLSDQVQTPSLEISQFEAKISELEKSVQELAQKYQALPELIEKILQPLQLPLLTERLQKAESQIGELMSLSLTVSQLQSLSEELKERLDRSTR
jgi:exonuclease VII small subunit